MNITNVVYTYQEDIRDRIAKDTETIGFTFQFQDTISLDNLLEMEDTSLNHYIIYVDDKHELLDRLRLYTEDKRFHISLVVIKEDIDYGADELSLEFSKGEINQLIYRLHERIARNNTLTNVVSISNPKPSRLYYTTDKRGSLYQSVLDMMRLKKPVLIRGERGVGKSSLAYTGCYQLIKQHPFIITIDCKRLYPVSLEDYFFGRDKTLGIISKFPNASYIIDSIEEASDAFQSRIKTLLDNGTYIKMNGDITLRANPYICFTTREDITRLGRCIPTLRQRLTPYEFILPTNDETPQDLIPIFTGILNERIKDYGLSEIKVSEQVIDTMRYYEYHDNIREIKTIVEHILLNLDGEKVVTTRHLPIEVSANKFMVNNISGKYYSLRDILETNIYNLAGIEKLIISGCIKKNRFMLGLTAGELGITQDELKARIKKYRISLKKLQEDVLS